MYAAGNSTYDFLYLSHVASEMNMEFQRPFKIQMDNTTAECFAKGTAFKSKLKARMDSHATRQEHMHSSTCGY